MLDWFNERIDLWVANALLVGLSAEMVSSFKAELEAVNAQRADTMQKRNASRAATSKLNDLAEATRATGASLIATIKAYAAATGDPDVFDLSQVPPPKPAAPLPPPVAPTNVTCALQPSGAIRIDWDGTVAHGVTYMVFRRTDPGTGFGPQTLVGSIGARTLVDSGLTGCVQTVGYQVRAVRGTQFSEFSTEATIRFSPAGEGAGGSAAAEAA
jgi:hypothetical protein